MLRLCAGVLIAVFSLLYGYVAASAAGLDWMKGETVTVQAERGFSGQQGVIKLGVFFPEISNTGTDADMNLGNGIEVGYGYQPLKYLSAEATVGYLQTDDYDDNVENVHASIKMVPVLATVRAIAPFRYFDIYVMGGGGMYYTYLKYDNQNIAYSRSISEDKMLWGYHYGGGVALPMGRGSTIGIEARRIETSWDNLDIAGTFLTAFMRVGF